MLASYTPVFGLAVYGFSRDGHPLNGLVAVARPLNGMLVVGLCIALAWAVSEIVARLPRGRSARLAIREIAQPHGAASVEISLIEHFDFSIARTAMASTFLPHRGGGKQIASSMALERSTIPSAIRKKSKRSGSCFYMATAAGSAFRLVSSACDTMNAPTASIVRTPSGMKVTSATPRVTIGTIHNAASRVFS